MEQHSRLLQGCGLFSQCLDVILKGWAKQSGSARGKSLLSTLEGHRLCCVTLRSHSRRSL